MDCQKIIDQCIKQGEPVIPELEAQKICGEFSIACPPTALAKDKEHCISAAAEMGFPVVLKIFSPQVIHKSDVGGVITGIENAEQLNTAYDQIVSNVVQKCPNAQIVGMLVQKQAAKGIEVVVGGLRNEQFGPVVMFGLGGIYVEIFKDVTFRLAPLSKAEALRMIEETKISAILKGARGAKACDLDALSGLIVNAGRLLIECPDIVELDFNPVFCYPDGCLAVDARMVPKCESSQ